MRLNGGQFAHIPGERRHKRQIKLKAEHQATPSRFVLNNTQHKAFRQSRNNHTLTLDGTDHRHLFIVTRQLPPATKQGRDDAAAIDQSHIPTYAQMHHAQAGSTDATPDSMASCIAHEHTAYSHKGRTNRNSPSPIASCLAAPTASHVTGNEQRRPRIDDDSVDTQALRHNTSCQHRHHASRYLQHAQIITASHRHKKKEFKPCTQNSSDFTLYSSLARSP